MLLRNGLFLGGCVVLGLVSGIVAELMSGLILWAGERFSISLVAGSAEPVTWVVRLVTLVVNLSLYLSTTHLIKERGRVNRNEA
jgi:hypothetical protein